MSNPTIIIGTEDADIIAAGNGSTDVYGLGGDDLLYGDNGDDYLVGGAGNDRLEGANGTDTLEGGLGKDVYWGGHGQDTIVERAGDTGLRNAERDRFNGGATGVGFKEMNDRFDIGEGAGWRTAFNGTDTIVLFDFNGDGRADGAVALKKEHSFLDASNFNVGSHQF